MKFKYRGVADDRTIFGCSAKFRNQRCIWWRNYVANHVYRAKKKENDALKAGVQALLRDRIIQAYNHYVQDKGWIPIYAKESIDACYKSYEALGDNGVIDNLMEQINELQNYPPKDKRMRGEDNA